MNLPVVIPLGGDPSMHDNIELRYTLRSIESYYGSPEIFIVGIKPHWLKNVHHLPFKEDPVQCRNKNVMQKLLLAAETLKTDFVRWSDDILALAPVESLPYYSQGTMIEAALRCNYRTARFQLVINNTIRKVGPHSPFFDIHTPIFIDHLKYSEFCAVSDWSDRNTHALRSYYCNWAGYSPTPFTDLKLFYSRTVSELDELCKERLFLSLGDESFKGQVVQWMAGRFPVKSRWE